MRLLKAIGGVVAARRWHRYFFRHRCPANTTANSTDEHPTATHASWRHP
eukprot:SAG11_NODE_29131_length_314_cov_0.720930_1_plen_48_part_01